MVWRKTQLRTNLARGSYGFLRTLELGYRNMCIRGCANAPLKKQSGANLHRTAFLYIR